jgi:predicted SAM-dependent methyltransferase
MYWRPSICAWSNAPAGDASVPGTTDALPAQEASGFLPSEADGEAESPASKIVLNVGCGYPLSHRLHPRFRGPGWRELRLDINPAVRPDILCSVTAMEPVADGSIDAIWSSHNLEHLYRHEVPVALGEFFRVLRPGGLVFVTLPDLQRVAALVVDDQLESETYMSPSGPITPLDMIFGHMASVARGDLTMAHRSGFTGATLRKLLEEAGFERIEIVQGTIFDLWATGYRPSTAAS